ncbi:uncharacterized protein LOC106153930 [Lingula anatina]|uniref:Uncharacterized protein LOC106153930 n=1 Tax=Lingula anatina TaxID=7574 RepID=A0A1S3HES2_LINAN|nr:uncharacterized protein LOC106153930 [Lingula anatina]|eukprot:XP_013383534.1 uncharacterized protein LOC106153930 [Lingula anatina]
MKLAPFLTVLFCVAVATQGSTFRSSSDVASAMVRGFMTKLFPIRQTQFASITPLFSTGSSSRGGVRLRGTLGSRVVSTATDPKPAPTMPDLMFVLDSSASIGSTNYTIGKSFMESIVNFIYSQAGATSTSKPRIGVVRFSEAAKTKVDFSLDTHTDAEQVKQAIRGIPYDNGVSTNTAEGLKLAKMELDNKGKPGNAKMIWILTDGNANSGGDPVRLATDIKKGWRGNLCKPNRQICLFVSDPGSGVIANDGPCVRSADIRTSQGHRPSCSHSIQAHGHCLLTRQTWANASPSGTHSDISEILRQVPGAVWHSCRFSIRTGYK